MLQSIRHIIFDLGGVLLNIDYSLTEKAFTEDCGISDFGSRYSQLKQTTLFDDFETGKISKTDFIKALQDIAPEGLAEDKICKAWNAMLLDMPLRRLQILQQLRIHYDLFLLSNTNEIHEEAFNKIITDTCSMPVGVFFDKVYLSHRAGMRKPDGEIFERILSENGLQPQHTLFIDDSPQHIEGARELGIQTIWLQKGMTIEKDIFKPRG